MVLFICDIAFGNGRNFKKPVNRSMTIIFTREPAHTKRRRENNISRETREKDTFLRAFTPQLNINGHRNHLFDYIEAFSLTGANHFHFIFISISPRNCSANWMVFHPFNNNKWIISFVLFVDAFFYCWTNTAIDNSWGGGQGSIFRQLVAFSIILFFRLYQSPWPLPTSFCSWCSSNAVYFVWLFKRIAHFPNQTHSSFVLLLKSFGFSRKKNCYKRGMCSFRKITVIFHFYECVNV